MKLSDSFASVAKYVKWGVKWTVFTVFLLQPLNAAASTSWKKVYVYEKPGGGHLITSSRLPHSKYRLVKTYKTRKTSTQKKVRSKSKARQSNRSHSSCSSVSAQKRADKHRRSIEIYSRVYGVDEALVHAIIKNESCYKVKAKSPVGAMGLMQLMPGTAKDMKISNPWDPEQNIQGGVRYISEMLKEFSGNTRLAVAAYNAGPGNVRKYKGIPPFRETRTYVKRVMGDYQRMARQYASR